MTGPRAENGEPLRWLRDVALKWESDECLLYPFAVGSHGYGALFDESGEQVLAHRYICLAAHGKPTVPKMEAAHSCRRTKLCCNKRHLRWDTRAGNLADMVAHGTIPRGEKHGAAKLTEADVLSIRDASGLQSIIAAEYGITQQTVSDIKTKRRWSWLQSSST